MRIVIFILAGCLLSFTVANTLYADSSKMGSPKGKLASYKTHSHMQKENKIETSAVKIPLLWAIRLFQKKLSPIDGPQCGFRPSCSEFGRRAIKSYGVFQGIMMAGDRLLRCNAYKKPGFEYKLINNGYLYDPIWKNTLTESFN